MIEIRGPEDPTLVLCYDSVFDKAWWDTPARIARLNAINPAMDVVERSDPAYAVLKAMADGVAEPRP